MRDDIYIQCQGLIKSACRDLKNIQILTNRNPLDRTNQYILKYAAIFSCGVVEQIVKKIIVDNLSKNSNRFAKYFFSEWLFDHGLNPKYSEIVKHLGRMDVDVKNDIKKIFQRSEMKRFENSLNSLVELRNKISHGADITVGIKDIREYFYASIIIIVHILKVVQLHNNENDTL